MLGENNIPRQHLLSSKKSGPQLVTISNVAKLRNDLGEEKLYKGNVGVVLNFSNDEIVHQELYWLHGYNYSKLLKLLVLLECNTKQIDKREVIGKKLWLVFKHVITMIGGQEESRECEIISMSPESKVPKQSSLIEEYINDNKSDPDEFPELKL